MMQHGLRKRIARLRQEITPLKKRNHGVREPPALGQFAVAAQLYPQRRIADRAGHDDTVPGLGGRTPHHLSVRHQPESRDRSRRKSWRLVRVAAEQRTAVARGILAEPSGKRGDPRLVGSRRQRDREQEAHWLGAFGGKIGKIHAQRFAADAFGRIVGKKVHASDHTVGCQYEIASRRRRQRGGIVNEADLADAIRNGHVQGAALDVFEKEPTTESPLFELPSVVVVPHLGASTFEAQDKAGITIAEQVQLALAGDFVPYAVNVAAGEVSNAVRPFMGLAEVLGRFIGGLLDGKPADLEVNYLGELAGSGTKILTLCALKGLLTATGHDGVSFVNAPQLAEDHNLTYSEVSTVESPEYVNQISVRSGDHAVSGTLVTIGTRLETRIVGVDGHSVEIPPAASMLVVHNDDRPGMIGMVGVALGAAGVSISSMAVGPDQRTKTALMVLSTEIPTPSDVIDRLRDTDGIQDIHLITLR